MKNALILILAGLLAGVVLTLWWQPGDDAGEQAGAGTSEVAESEQLKALAARVSALEDQLAAVTSRQSSGPLSQGPGPVVPEDAEDPVAAEEEEEESGFTPSDDPRDFRRNRLEEVGFAPMEAERILDLEQTLRLDRLEERWKQRRQAYLDDPERFGLTEDNPLRAQLGDEAYERYLEANGRATEVSVGGVFEQSPAAAAGLQPGDEILRYDGERVFNLRELNAVSVQGNHGEPVLVDVMRDGLRVQLAIERGPLGITVRRRGRRGF